VCCGTPSRGPPPARRLGAVNWLRGDLGCVILSSRLVRRFPSTTLTSMGQPLRPYRVDPEDPRAPSEEVWARLSPAERASVVESLPSEFPITEANPPEGDAHFNAKARTRDTLGGYFARTGRRVYLACELPVYYPNESMFAPDVLAVVDVETHERERWVVSAEGKGLDLALEVFVSGDRRKDMERNVELYARLGISEYFVFDRGRLRLLGYRLPTLGSRVYQPMMPQGGRYASQVLGLDLRIEDKRLRFFHGMTAVPEAQELIAKLEMIVGDVEARALAAEERADHEAKLRMEEAKLRAEEAKLRAEAERKLAAALVEIERLKGLRKEE
jgi:Uma2 family endonuclease